ncbi:Pac2p [Sporobolomyces salmoneus]|uniref:Pac2p n=1 Tax=Sporobolomyces salmoneus TaxID=183962 RepID=UPI00317677A3
MPRRVQYEPPPTHKSTSSIPNSPPPLPQLGTILYRGLVPPTKGEWLGIEWDDLSRGKHSGTHEKSGVRYFETRVEGAGSFLRPNAPGLTLEGKSFKQAFESKYLQGQSTTSENGNINGGEETTSEFYKTSSNFEVEVVLSEKVAARFRQLGRLREAGLEWEGLGRAYDSDRDGTERELDELGSRLSGLEVLNLSCTMLGSIEEAERIAQVLPKLSTLSLNSNRFDPVDSPTPLPGFERLSTLKLNNTLLSWPELIRISPSLPNLVELEFGFNRLTTLSSANASETPLLLPELETLNLESNFLSDWEETIKALSSLPSLTKLVLASNRFADLSLPPPSPASPILRKLRHLSLSSNLLSSWSNSIDALGESQPTTFPALTSLNLAENPLASSPSSNGSQQPSTAESDSSGSSSREREQLHRRLNVIARLGFLDTLEGTAISKAEREDAERFWITNHDSLGSDEALSDGASRTWASRRLDELRKKYGQSPINGTIGREKSQSESKTASASTMKSRLIRLRVVDSTTAESPSFCDPPLELSVLSTLRTLLLRAQLSRLIGKPLPKTKYRLIVWLKSKDKVKADEGKWIKIEVPTNEEGREVSWWGVEEGDAVGYEAI